MVTPVGSGNTDTGYKFTWRGATVRAQIDAELDSAMQELAGEVLNWLHANLHVYTGPNHNSPPGQMRDLAFASVEVRGTKRTVVAGSDAPHTLYHEYRWHPQLRECLDTFAPKLTQLIKQHVASVGR